MIKDSSAVPQLIGALQDEDEVVRMQAVRSLGNIKDLTTVDTLIYRLQNDSSDYVQAEAAEALGRIGGDKAFDALVQALLVESEFIRMSAALALAEIGDKRALSSLQLALENTEDPFAKQRISEAIAKLSNE